jgi:hypothetical protein
VPANHFLETTVLTRGLASPIEAEDKQPSKENDSVDFGKGFGNNLRGAFM